MVLLYIVSRIFYTLLIIDQSCSFTSLLSVEFSPHFRARVIHLLMFMHFPSVRHGHQPILRWKGGSILVNSSAGFHSDGSQWIMMPLVVAIHESTANMDQLLLARLSHPFATLESVHIAHLSGANVIATISANASATLMCCRCNACRCISEMLILQHCLLENLLKLFLLALTIKFLSCENDIKHSFVNNISHVFTDDT